MKADEQFILYTVLLALALNLLTILIAGFYILSKGVFYA